VSSVQLTEVESSEMLSNHMHADGSGTQSKENVCRWKSLPGNDW
jgi:hypothetical protein